MNYDNQISLYFPLQKLENVLNFSFKLEQVIKRSTLRFQTPSYVQFSQYHYQHTFFKILNIRTYYEFQSFVLNLYHTQLQQSKSIIRFTSRQTRQRKIIIKHQHRSSQNLQQLIQNLRKQIIYSKLKSNIKTKLQVSVAFIKSQNSKFRYEIKEILNKYISNPRVEMKQCSSFHNQFIKESDQLILIIHSQDIPFVTQQYQQFIKSISYQKLVVIVFGQVLSSHRFKFDVKVNSIKQLEKQIDWLIKQSIHKIKIMDPQYEIVILQGDNVFMQFCKQLPFQHRKVQKLTNKQSRSIIIAPSSKQKQLVTQLQTYPQKTFGILVGVELNPIVFGNKYHHSGMKLQTNSMNQCIRCIEQINEISIQKKTNTRKRQNSQYNPAKANMWRKLQNQLRNEVSKSKRSLSRDKLQRQRILSNNINVNNFQIRIATSPNQQYGIVTSTLNNKKNSNQPSTQLSSLIPSKINQQNLQKSKPQQLNQQSSMSFGQLSSIPNDYQLYSQLQSNIENIQINKPYSKSKFDESKREPFSNIQNVFHSTSRINQQTFNPKSYNLVLQSKDSQYFPSCSGPIQLFFKTKNIYINKLQQFFDDSSKFLYKYQSLSDLKMCLRSSHQQMISLAIIDEQQMIETMRLLAVFDNMFFLIATTTQKIQQLKEKVHPSIGFLAEQISLKRTYKDVTAYMRLLRMRHYKISDNDLRDFANNVANNSKNAILKASIFCCDKHVETLVRLMDHQNYFNIYYFNSLQELQVKLQDEVSKGIIILNSHLASISNSLIQKIDQTLNLVIFETDRKRLVDKPLGVKLVTSDKELIHHINSLDL